MPSPKPIIAALLLPVILTQLTGCTKQVWVGPGEVRPEEPQKVRVVRTVDGQEVTLDRTPTPLIRGDSLYASVVGQPYSIPVDQIKEYRLERTDTSRTISLVVLPIIIVGFVAFFNSLDNFTGSLGGG